MDIQEILMVPLLKENLRSLSITGVVIVSSN